MIMVVTVATSARARPVASAIAIDRFRRFSSAVYGEWGEWEPQVNIKIIWQYKIDNSTMDGAAKVSKGSNTLETKTHDLFGNVFRLVNRTCIDV